MNSFRFVAAIMDCVSQRTQLGGCAQEAEDGSPSVLIARDRSVEVVLVKWRLTPITIGLAMNMKSTSPDVINHPFVPPLSQCPCLWLRAIQ